MGFKSNDLFIDPVEFITILMPGAVLALVFIVVESNLPGQINIFKEIANANHGIATVIVF